MKLNNNLRQTIRIAKIELSSMFYSPVAWLVLIIFALLLGYDYSNNVTKLITSMERGRQLFSITENIYTSWMGGMLAPILRNLYLYIPLVTMGLMSREYQTGSIKLLYSSPINNTSIILGKFLAMMVYGFVLIAILGANVLFSAIVIENFNYQVLLIALLGIYLLILAYSSIGLFMSSITQYPVVAAIGTLAILAVLNFIGEVGQSIDFVRDITYWLSLTGRSRAFIIGLLPSADVIYFVIIIILFIALSIFKLNTEKSIMTKKVKTIKYSIIVLVALFFGYISSLPTMKLYYDGTYNKSNTLARESQEAIKDLTGKLTITTYVNLLAQEIYPGLPWNRNSDIARFEKYIRFKPDIKMKYVYYYDEAYNPDLDEKCQNMTLKEKAEHRCKTFQLDIDDFLTPEEIRKVIDLSAEGNQFLRIVEAEDGEKIILRMYNDSEKHPRETEVSAAFKRLTNSAAPIVGFNKGNGSRDITNYGGRGFYLFASDKWFRNSLLNQGFDTKEVNLDTEDISEDITTFVISDLREPLSEVAMERIKRYIDKGGNLFILGEYQRSENMNPLSEYIGVTFSDGVLACNNELISPVVTIASYDPAALKDHGIWQGLYDWGYGVSMPTAVALNYSEINGFKVTPILKTNNQTWLEYQTTDLVDGEFSCDEGKGEKKDSYTTLLKLTRMVGDKEQRILVSGDTDAIANEEMGVERPGGTANNFGLISGAFRWFSNDKYPISTEKDRSIDNKLKLPGGSGIWVNIIFIGIIPGILIFLGVFLIVRRQRK